MGLAMGLLVSLGLRYRLLWFWVFGWPRGVGMVRKWKWSLLANTPNAKSNKSISCLGSLYVHMHSHGLCTEPPAALQEFIHTRNPLCVDGSFPK